MNLNQDKATKPQIVRQGEATLYWFLLIHYIVNPLYKSSTKRDR
ncbi:IS1106 transposase [Neisseria meningitidis H44/76]|uniref:IS1106 transposase n=2 Tax=Neisseria meningitidis TaxID=487 RepID=E6MVI5_NEIMH|nr:hypothetical protein HMPREF0602_1909 [Neisseria meningitidis ATCC 13091]EFV64592.1 IS1106 transposase [Neisseria meningitidis H44/76]KER38809.1 transposase domain protein [Neisseria meningitidis 992008]